MTRQRQMMGLALMRLDNHEPHRRNEISCSLEENYEKAAREYVESIVRREIGQLL